MYIKGLVQKLSFSPKHKSNAQVRIGRPDHGQTSYFENEIGFFQEYLMKDYLLRAYYLGFDWSGWIVLIDILITTRKVWPVSSPINFQSLAHETHLAVDSADVHIQTPQQSLKDFSNFFLFYLVRVYLAKPDSIYLHLEMAVFPLLENL